MWAALDYVPTRYCKAWFGQFNQSTLVTAGNICAGVASGAGAAER
jgi:hypothetical protein